MTHDEICDSLGVDSGHKLVRVHYISDVHNDYNDCNILDELPGDSEGILVVAGDIHPKGKMVQDIEAVAHKWGDIIAVPGNHDWWGLAIHEYHKFISDVDNVHILMNSWTEIKGITFVGGTGWFNASSPLDWAYWSRFSDSKRIRGPQGERFLLLDAAIEHRKFTELAIEMQYVEGPKVLISHHLMLDNSIDARFKGDPFNPFYVTHRPEVVQGYEHYIHGHTHHVQAYEFEGTKVHSNPWGYGEEIPDRQMRYFEVLV